MAYSTSSDCYKNNKSLLYTLKPGDLVEFPRGIYSHWAVYLGNEEVCHLAGDDDDGIDNIKPEHLFTVSGVKFSKAKVVIDDFWKVADKSFAKKNNSKDSQICPLPGREIVKRARQLLGRVGYNVITRNCEHFAKWCRYNIAKSDQVDMAVTGLAVGGAILGVAGLIHGIVKYWGSESEEEKKEKERKNRRMYTH